MFACLMKIQQMSTNTWLDQNKLVIAFKNLKVSQINIPNKYAKKGTVFYTL